MNGFEEDIQTKILGTQSHIIVSTYDDGIGETGRIIEKILDDPEVSGASPFILSQGLISAAASFSGVVIRGIDTKSAPSVIRIRDIMTQGSFEDLDDSGILVGSELALQSGIMVGDTVSIISPAGTITPLGMIPKSRGFIVRGLFSTGMYEYDSNMVYISLDAAKELFMKEVPSGIEIKVKDIYAAEQTAERLTDSLGPLFWAKTWKDMNKSLFSALKMEKTVMFIILLFICLVAGFSIISTLIMLVMDKKRDIAILKSMGATTAQILKIFIYMGMVIGVTGTVVGVVLGLGLAHNLNPIISFVEYAFNTEIMPKDVYYITGLPIRIRPQEVCAIAMASLGLSFISTIYPARQAAAQDPVEAMRYGE